MLIATILLLAAAPQAADTEGPAALRTADARLNAQYRATTIAMQARDARDRPSPQDGPTSRQALVSAQRAWIAYRDANCLSVSYEYRGGSAQGLSHRTCLIRMTQERTAELRRIARGSSPD